MSQCLSTGRTFYRLFDSDPGPHGCHVIPCKDEAPEWNQKKWGIYWTVNEFDGPRQNKNLKRIIAWAVDIDEGTKEQQRAQIKKYPTPSLIVETKRGYQLYFHTNDATVENHKEIQDRLVIAYGGDKNAKDIARILRVPGYRHWKDENEPFTVLVKHISEGTFFKEKAMLKFYLRPNEEKKLEQKNQSKKELSFLNNDNLFDRIYSMDCEQALLRLSGQACVGGESFSFKRNANGNLNLMVNGKGTSVFIDKNKRIGSSDKGGPTIFNFIKWYGHNNSETTRIMKEIFPEVFNERV